MILGNIYKPPKDNNNNAYIESFITELTPQINNLLQSKSNIILCGDFNINLLQIKNRPIFSDYFELMTTNGLYPAITYPTRFTDTNCTLIDNIFYKSKYNNTFKSSGILLTDISDHLPCFAIFQQNVYLNDSKEIFYQRSFSERNKQLLYNEIESKNIYTLLDTSLYANVNETYNILESEIVSSLDKIIPLKKNKFNKYKHKKVNGQQMES